MVTNNRGQVNFRMNGCTSVLNHNLDVSLKLQQYLNLRSLKLADKLMMKYLITTSQILVLPKELIGKRNLISRQLFTTCLTMKTR